MTVGPNFFVVGAPKCGTTALCDQLGQHPEIFIPQRKEFHFFAKDLTGSDLINTEDYLSHFKEADQYPVRGEGSTWHLFSSEAANHIYEFNSSAKIISCVRNPVNLVYSLHNYYLFKGLTREKRIARLISEEDEYCRSLALGDKIDNSKIYKRAAIFSEKIENYKRLFGNKGVLIIFHEDLKRDPAAVLRKCFNFLDVSPEFVPVNRAVNVGGVKRSHAFADFIAWRPPLLTALAYKVPKPIRRATYRKLDRMNTSRRPPPPMPHEVRRELCDFFAEDVAELARMTGRDLSHWLRP